MSYIRSSLNLLANRLQQIFPKFVSGRKIQKNTFLAQEILHDMRKKRGKKGWMGLKIDMGKAYDRLEWCFLEKVLRAFSFPSIWI